MKSQRLLAAAALSLLALGVVLLVVVAWSDFHAGSW